MLKSDNNGQKWNLKKKKLRGRLIKGRCFVRWVCQKENKKMKARIWQIIG